MFRWILLFLIVAILALQYRLWFGEANMREVWQLRQEIERQRSENDHLVVRNHQLDAEVKDLKQGLAALEERARNELGMVKEGETFFQLVPALSQPDTSNSKQ